MLIVALILLISFIYSLIMIKKNNLSREKNIFLFPVIDLLFSIVIVAVVILKLENSLFEVLIMFSCFIYILYRSKSLKNNSRHFKNNNKNKKKGDE